VKKKRVFVIVTMLVKFYENASRKEKTKMMVVMIVMIVVFFCIFCVFFSEKVVKLEFVLVRSIKEEDSFVMEKEILIGESYVRVYNWYLKWIGKRK